MKNLLDPKDDYLKTENNIKIYLKSLSDSDLKSFYNTFEFTPFSLLLVKEYKKRFGRNQD